MESFTPYTDDLSEYELIPIPEACRLLGGSRPISAATLYRGIAAGIYPRPIKIGNSARLLKREILAVIRARIAERDREVA